MRVSGVAAHSYRITDIYRSNFAAYSPAAMIGCVGGLTVGGLELESRIKFAGSRRVAAIHPDLCDDSVDRVINGIHFGKKWKHAVRTAQQSLKNKGTIVLEGVQRRDIPDSR